MRAKAAALVAFSLTIASPHMTGLAQPQASISQQKVLRISFSPPLKQRLNYEVAISRTGDGKTTTMRIFQLLIFERVSRGYVLTISTMRMVSDNLSIDLTTPSGIDRVPVELRPLLMPLSLDITSEGEISRVRDWPGVRRAIARIPDAIAAAEIPAKRATAVEIGKRVVAPYLSMTAEQAPSAILKGWPSLFGMGGAELVEGETYETQVTSQPPMLPVEIPVTQTIKLTRAGDGLFHLEVRSQPDEKKMGLAISQYFDRLGVGMTAEQKANLAKAGQRFRAMKMRDSSVVDLNGQSGIIRRAHLERWMSFPDMGAATEVITVTRID